MANLVIENNLNNDYSAGKSIVQEANTIATTNPVQVDIQMTDEQLLTQLTIDLCKKSIDQNQSQLLTSQYKILKQQLDDALVQLGNIPSNLINDLYSLFTQLMKIANGYTDPSTYDFDPNAVIDTIISMLQPIIDALSALPVPSIPGLSQLVELLNKLKAMQDGNGSSQDKLPDIPSEIMYIINDLLTTIQSICMALPMVLLNVVFQMLNAIIGMFGQIAGVIGVPGIPFPLSLVPQCISLAPKITDLVINLPIKLQQIVTNIIKRKIAIISSSIPSCPEDINLPGLFPPCPQRDDISDLAANITNGVNNDLTYNKNTVDSYKNLL